MLTIAFDPLIHVVALAGAAVNAASGILEAGRKPFDLFGMLVVALAAALGDGTLRDLLLDRTVFWLADQTYLIVALSAGLVTFALARTVRLPPQAVFTARCFGVGVVYGQRYTSGTGP